MLTKQPKELHISITKQIQFNYNAALTNKISQSNYQSHPVSLNKTKHPTSHKRIQSNSTTRVTNSQPVSFKHSFSILTKK